MTRKILMGAAFVLAIGSAFTTKATKALVNPTGYVTAGSGETNAPDCGLNNGANCSIVVNHTTFTTVYDSVSDIGDPTKVMKRP